MKSNKPMSEEDRRKFLADIVSSYRYTVNLSDLGAALDEIEALFISTPTVTLQEISAEMAEYLDDYQGWLGSNGHPRNGHLEIGGEHSGCDACRRRTSAMRLYDKYELETSLRRELEGLG